MFFKIVRNRCFKNIILIITAFFLLNYFLSDFFFPTLIQKFILPQINSRTSIKIDCEIRKLSFFSFSAYDIRIHNTNTEIIRINHLYSEYFLFGLLGVNELQIYGLEIFFPFSEKKVSSKEENINYLSLFNQILNQTEDFKPSSFIRSLSSNFFVAKLKGSKLSVKNSKLYFRTSNGKILYFPFELEGHISDEGKFELRLNADSLFGNGMVAIMANNSGEISSKTKISSLELNKLINDSAGKLNADLSIFFSDLQKTVDFLCEIRNLSISSGKSFIKSSNDKAKLSFNIDLKNKKAVFELGNIMFSGDFPVFFNSLSGELSFNIPEKINIKALGNLKFSKSASNFSVISEEIPFRIDGELTKDLLTFNLKNANNSKKIYVNSADYNCQGDITCFEFESEYKRNFNFKGALLLSDIESNIKDGKLKIPEIKFSAELKDGKLLETAKIANTTYEKGAIQIMGIEGLAKIANMPFIELEGKANNIKLGGIDYGRASLTGNLDLSKKELKILGDYFLEAPSYHLPFQGEFNFSEKNKSFKIRAMNDDYLKLDKFSLGRFANSINGFFAEGELKIIYELDYYSGIFHSRFEKWIRNFNIENPSKELKIIGIDGGYISKDFSLMKSLPSMRFFAKSLTFGKIKLDNIELLYTLESPKSFYIEKLSAGWCSGNFYIFSTRFDNSGRKEITLYFDRILLSEMLSEFGLCEGSGDGRVNGKVPFIIDGNDIEFKNAFFYSTPGIGGNIKIQKANALKDSINSSGGQLSPVDITFEALKDFNYDWSKITLNTEGDDILMKIEFLGSPSHSLPFHFNRQTGTFSRVEANLQGSIFKEIKLDLNCRLPFNAIMRYINTFKDFLKIKNEKGGE